MLETLDDFERASIGSRRHETRPYDGGQDRSQGFNAIMIERDFVKELEIAFRTAVMLSFRGPATAQTPKPGELMKYRVQVARFS